MTASLLTHTEAVTVLKRGGVIAYPTEAVWGLGCDPRSEAAVLRLLSIKQRTVDRGLILIASHLQQLRPFLDMAALPAARLDHVLATWPGPYTWVMPASPDAPRWITGAHSGLAVRVSAHPGVVALCDAFGGPLVSTSANLSGQPAACTYDALDPALLAAIDGVVKGTTGGLSAPTPIRDAITDAALRA